MVKDWRGLLVFILLVCVDPAIAQDTRLVHWSELRRQGNAAPPARAAAKLVEKRGDVSADQVRAIERLKDRTGFFVVMGSAADAVSYEATRYGQGLLTYALLQALKAAALRDGEYVDVSTLFQFAADQVPELARDIGGIQRPSIAAPHGSSFDVGRLTEQDKGAVPLARLKAMLLRPVFMNGDEGEDTLQLTSAVRKLLREQSYSGERGRETPVYVDADELPGAVRISGVYKLANGQVEFKLRLRRGGEPKSVRLVLPQADIATMAATLVDRLNREIASPQ